MSGSVPTVERPPGVREPYLGMWRYALKCMKESGAWDPALRPLLDEMIHCWRLANEHRARAEAEGWAVNRESGLEHAHDGFKSALAHTARAIALADALGLTPKAKKALALKAEEPLKEPDAFQAADELAPRRARAAHA